MPPNLVSTQAPNTVLERSENPHVVDKADNTRPNDRWYIKLAVALAYLAFASLANYEVWAHGVTHTIQTAGAGDVPEEIWFLGQTPWALVHLHNPFVTNWLNAPAGVNLMDNTSMSLLGLVGAPITFLFGPIATYNILLDLGFASSALAFYFMVRRFVRWRPAAFVGGLLYGFSPFATAEGLAHLFLVFAAIPPLVILLLDRFLRTKSDPPWRTGVLIGACFAAQFFISAEMFASMVVMSVIAIVFCTVYWLVRKQPVVDVRGLAKAGVWAVGVTALLAGYGVWMSLLGPVHIHGPEQSPTTIAGISADPAGWVVPTMTQRLGFGEASYGDSLVAQRTADWSVVVDAPIENGTYVGIPLLVVLTGGCALLKRKRMVLFSASMAAAAVVLSLGSRLHVGGARSAIRLPFDVLAHLPLLQSGVAARYMVFFWLFAALLLALILDALYRWLIGKGKRHGDLLRATAVCLFVVLLALIPLVPAWPYGSGQAYVPSWFTTSARSLPVGTTVVVYPMASLIDPSSMTWQAMANFTFRMPGGYAVFKGSGGTATFISSPSPLQAALGECAGGGQAQLSPETIRTELRSWHVSLVAVASPYRGSACAAQLFSSAYGRPSLRRQVLLWRIRGSD
jgi:hypothetical protein